jgi:hypothetical protein
VPEETSATVSDVTRTRHLTTRHLHHTAVTIHKLLRWRMKISEYLRLYNHFALRNILYLTCKSDELITRGDAE